MLREQPSCLAISLIPSPLRAITRISTACSWVNIDGQKTAIVAQVGHFHFGAVGQFYIGANSYRHNGLAEAIKFSSGNYGGRLTNQFLAAQEAAQARSREEIRRLSAEAAESLRSLAESQRLLSEQAVQNERQAEEIRILNEQLAARKRDQFGPHSEKTHGSDVSSAKSAHESEKRPFSGAGRKRLPDGLDRVERVYDIKDGRCPICNTEMVELLNETENSELLRVQPIKFHVEDVVRTKYVCRHCKHFVTAPGPSRIAHSSYGSPDFSALTIVNKYQLGIPDYRQAHWFGSLGLKVPRITLDNNHIACAQRLRPLVDALRVALVEQPYIHADETTMQCLKENGRLPESKSWMFVYLSGECEDHPVVLFDYQHTRAGEHALHFLTRPDGTSFDGALQVDGFEGYNCLGSAERYGCMAHARRRFFKAEEAVPAGSEEESLAAQARKMIDEAYDVERSAKGLPWIERQKVRKEKTAPVMARLKEWLDAHAPDLPRRSLLGKAVHYMQDQWDRLIAFIDNGRIEIDNNSVERQIRKFAMACS